MSLNILKRKVNIVNDIEAKLRTIGRSQITYVHVLYMHRYMQIGVDSPNLLSICLPLYHNVSDKIVSYLPAVSKYHTKLLKDGRL